MDDWQITFDRISSPYTTDLCHPKEAPCQKRKKVTEAFLRLNPHPPPPPPPPLNLDGRKDRQTDGRQTTQRCLPCAPTGCLILNTHLLWTTHTKYLTPPLWPIQIDIYIYIARSLHYPPPPPPAQTCSKTRSYRTIPQTNTSGYTPHKEAKRRNPWLQTPITRDAIPRTTLRSPPTCGGTPGKKLPPAGPQHSRHIQKTTIDPNRA